MRRRESDPSGMLGTVITALVVLAVLSAAVWYLLFLVTTPQ